MAHAGQAPGPTLFRELGRRRMHMNDGQALQAVDNLVTGPDPGVIFAVETCSEEELYRVWACDNQVYGPIPRAVLLEWIQDSRVHRDTWIYVESLKGWYQADTVTELKGAFAPGQDTMFLERQHVDAQSVDPYELRMFPALAGLSNRDLAQFIQLSELVYAHSGDLIIRRRDPGDAIFFVLSGGVRARIVVGGEEKLLARITAGEFLGEMSMFTQSPRSADIIAEEDTRLLRFTAESFRTLIEQNPAAAAPMLYAISSTMAQRIMQTNNKFQTEVASGFNWR